MRILLVADLRSPHAQGWVAGVESLGHEVETFATLGDGNSYNSRSTRGRLSKFRSRLPNRIAEASLTTEALLRFRSRQQRLSQLYDQYRPHLVHALRIPYEGVTTLSALSNIKAPIVASVWGVDFTGQASSDLVLRSWMRQTLPKLDGLHVDDARDIARAREFGCVDIPTVIAAANFGMAPRRTWTEKEDLVLAPRGFNNRMATQIMLSGLRWFLSQNSFSGKVIFLNSTGEDEITRLANEFPTVTIQSLGWVSDNQFRDITSRARVVLSPGITDGMPISVLEAIQHGAVPVVFDLPQFAELQAGGVTIVRLDKEITDPAAYAQAIHDGFRLSHTTVGALPPNLLQEHVSERVSEFYETVVNRKLRMSASG